MFTNGNMALTTSTGVGNEFRQPHQSIFRNFQESILHPLPPSLNCESRVKWNDYLTTTNQNIQNNTRNSIVKNETRFPKPKLCKDVTYLKDFCEKIVREPYTAYGMNVVKYPKVSETKNKYVPKLTEARIISALGEKTFKAENHTLSNNLLNFKKDFKAYSNGMDHIDLHDDPYSTTTQRVHRLFKPNELYNGIGKKDAITLFTEMNPRPVKENEINSIVLPPPSSFLARTCPCAVDTSRRRATCPWPHYTTFNRNKTTRPRLISETQYSFNKNSLVNYVIETQYKENRNKIEDVVPPNYSTPKYPNMFRTSSSSIGENKPVVFV